MDFAERMSRIPASTIRKLFDQARSVPDAIDLSIGQADFDVPEPIREATIAAIRRGCGGYGPTGGLPELVARTRAHLESRGMLAGEDEVMITAGATGGLSLALFALVGPGDEVLIPDPHFVLYDRLARLAGATPVLYDLYPSFELSAQAIAARLTSRTRVLILNSPSNPTGAVFAADRLAEVARLAAARGVFVISDELYDRFTYDGPHQTIKRAGGAPSLLIGGFSKAFGMAGWRVGFAAGPAELIDAMRTLQQFLYVCPATVAQHGALAAFDVDVSDHLTRYRKKRDLIYRGLVSAGYRVSEPGGSFFIFPEVPWGDDERFTGAAREAGLFVVPGRAFSARTTHFRISFAASDETLARGLEVLAKLRKMG
ncbi:MAG: aminotransferase class I/II-fold pyridoxal phosphate-dependent enzyme [Deltaproteobacteria bacterium]|nr:aminotransferase class I/II-fold pyridoxal phosphate-dependent enzyme [Deltaproteobacteria bacterium]